MDQRSRFLLVLIALTLLVSAKLSAQMVVGQDTLYGNEWIDYSKTYWKIKVARQDMYRVPFQVLQDGGFPVDQVPGEQYQLFVYGQEVPLYVSTDSLFGPDDYFEFYGDKNKCQLDQFLFEDGLASMLNPEVSLYTDTSVYFLTVSDNTETPIRFDEIFPIPIPYAKIIESVQDTSRIDLLTWHYSRTYDNNGEIRYSIYDQDEGLASPSSKLIQIPMDCPGIIPDSNALLELKLISNLAPHHLTISINGQAIYEDTAYTSGTVNTLQITIPENTLSTNNLVSIAGIAGNSDRYQLVNAAIQYFRSNSIDPSRNTILTFVPTPSERILTLATQDPIILYDLKDKIRVKPITTNDTIDIPLPSTTTPRTIIISPEKADLNLIDTISKIQFIDYLSDPGDYIIITHESLRNGPNGSDPIDDYAAYRHSAPGGNFKAQVIMIEQLINQFGYGIQHHPQCIRNWSAISYQTGIDYANIFLIGKGIEYRYIRIPSLNAGYLNLISPFGFPASDNLLCSALHSSRPYYPISRLSVRNPSEVQDYLDKIITYESYFRVPRTIQTHRWLKNGIHLVGGGNTNEIQYHQNLLHEIESTITEEPLGLQVETLINNSTDPVSNSSVEYLINKINEGLLVKTYLGHGATSTTGNFVIDDADLLDNTGKYPFVFSLGCLTGDMYTTQYSVSETFTLEKDKGALAYMASSGLGFPNHLTEFTKTFFEKAAFGKGIGKMAQETREAFDQKTSFGIRSLRDQFSIHGDPAIQLIADTLPDLVVDYTSIKTLPSTLFTNTETIDIAFDIWNLGFTKPILTLLSIRIEDPDGTLIVFQDTVQIQTSSVRHSFSWPGKDIKLKSGEYKLMIQIDPDNSIAEVQIGGEDNNHLSGPNKEDFWTFQVLNNEIIPLWPLPFSIVHTDSLEMIVYAPDQNQPVKKILIQLDSVPTYDSPGLITNVDTSSTILRHLNIKQTLQSDVYFWRIAELENDLPPDSLFWIESSFLIDSVLHSGWNQSHTHQFAKNELANLDPISSDTTWRFQNTFINITARSAVNSIYNEVATTFHLDNNVVYVSVSNPSLNIMVVDPTTGHLKTNRSFLLNGNNQKRKEAIEFIRDEVEAGDYVVCATFKKKGNDYGLADWVQDSILYGDNLYSVLEAQGAQLIRQLQQNESGPYTFGYRKDYYPLAEDTGDPGEENAIILFDIPVSYSEGTALSRPIGPALHWDSLSIDLTFLTEMAEDSTKITLYGFKDTTSLPDVILPLVHPKEDLSFIDANTYPYLKLMFHTEDSIPRIPGQLNYWRIFYRPAPDFIASYSKPTPDNLNEGDSLLIPFQCINASYPYDDSIQYWIIHTYPDFTSDTMPGFIHGLSHQEEFESTFKLEAIQNPGLHTFRLDVNPNDNIIETEYRNNRALFTVEVRPHLRPPLIDVFFDQIKIATRSLVNEKPVIDIYLYYQNQQIDLSDTNNLNIKLYTQNQTRIPLYYQSADIKITPIQTGNTNQLKATFNPHLHEAGLYTLDVTASDRSVKPVQTSRYTVQFKVDQVYKLHEFKAFPNPSSGQISFLYNYTGPKPPDQSSFTIYSATGQRIKRLVLDEQINLYPGIHVLPELWLGDDENGQPVPSGIYFYMIELYNENHSPIPGSGKIGTIILHYP